MNRLLNQFIRINTTDVINNKLRPILRDDVFQKKITKESIINKEPFDDNLLLDKNITLNNPFDTLHITSKTSVQEFVDVQLPDYNKYQAYLYNTSCGSGKTLAGLYAMYKLRCKTLIISTRNAINDQWEQSIEKCFPQLKICTREDYDDETGDVYIYSPQYLANKFMERKLNVSLIIYDEIHSLLSDVFSKVISAPYRKVLNGDWKQLPYFIGLTATLPQLGSEDRCLLDSIFGKPFSPKSSIVSIPINVWDYRNEFEEDERGMLDLYYKPLDDNKFVRYCIDKITNSKEIIPSTKFKGMVMTSTINSSLWSALYIHKVWNVSVLIVRAADEKCIFLEKDKGLDYSFDENVSMSSKFGTSCKLYDKLTEAAVLCGCFHRLKEGFSVENCTWGIITKFVWSLSTRVQMLGRIRRYSTSKELNEHKRIFYVCSGKIPNNLFLLKKYSKKTYRELIKEAKIDYNFGYEKKIFEKENIIWLN